MLLAASLYEPIQLACGGNSTESSFYWFKARLRATDCPSYPAIGVGCRVRRNLGKHLCQELCECQARHSVPSLSMACMARSVFAPGARRGSILTKLWKIAPCR